MFNSKDILARLQAGERIEDIAQSAADALNSAKAEYDKIEAEKKAAAAKAEAEKKVLQEKKEQGATNLVATFIEFVNEFYPYIFGGDELADFYKAFDPAQLVEAFDQAAEELKKIPAVAKALKEGNGEATVKLTGQDAKTAEDTINKFLRENHLF